MSEIFTDICITSVKATVLELFGIKSGKDDAEPDSIVMEAAESLGKISVEKAVIYNPDAVATWLYEKYHEKFENAEKISDVAVSLKSVMPSVTPVCFASMYSGVMPEIHGIQKYEKPVLKVETLFDCFIKSGKKAAIVSTAGDSISKIFLEREMDYYIYPTVAQVNRKARQLIKKNCYDLLVIYNGNYDHFMHSNGPESKKALRTLDANLAFYDKIVSEIKKYMSDDNVFFGFCPDHGCHEIDGNRGSHGLDMEEDMNVIHFYGFSKKA